MYDNLKFIEDDIYHPKDLKELIDISEEKFQFQSELIDLTNISVTESGQFVKDGHSFNMTQDAFLSLCKQLKIPDPFAKYIPWDLLQENITRLGNFTDKPVHLFFKGEGSDRHIVNFAKEKFIPIPDRTFVEAFQDAEFNLERSSISNKGIQVDVTNPIIRDNDSFEVIEPKVGDTIKTGLSFMNSTSGFINPQAKIFLWRLVCSNGMIAPTKIGQAKCRVKPNRDFKVILNNFLDQIMNMDIQAKMLANGWTKSQRTLNTDEFGKYWKGINKILREPDMVDSSIFMVDKETRGEYNAQRRLAEKHNESFEETEVVGFDLMNNITDQAKQFNPKTKHKLEEYAGKMLVEFAG